MSEFICSKCAIGFEISGRCDHCDAEWNPKEKVPFYAAAVERKDGNFSVNYTKTPSGKVVGVGVDPETKDRLIIIRSPTQDGKVSELKFALSNDASVMLEVLLIHARETYK